MNFTIKENRSVVHQGEFLRRIQFDGKGYEWSCWVGFEDAALQIPIAAGFYIWDLDDPWDENMDVCLSAALGYPVKVSAEHLSGNGHGAVTVTRLEAKS